RGLRVMIPALKRRAILGMSLRDRHLAQGRGGPMACRSGAKAHCYSVTRKRWIYLIGAVGVAAGVLAVVFAPEREPEYGGKKLSEWVDHYFRELNAPASVDPTAIFI